MAPIAQRQKQTQRRSSYRAWKRVEPYPQHDAADMLVTAVTHSLSRLEWRSREGRLGTLSRQGIARESRATVWESTGGMDFGHGDGVRRDGRGRIRSCLFEREKRAGTRERVAAVSLYGGRAWRIGRSIPDYPEVHGGFMVSLRLWPRPGHGRGVRELLQRTGSPDRGVARAIRFEGIELTRA
jgi:hypothetical protein